MKFYAVAIGRTTGVFATWDETKPQVNGYSGAKHKSFKSREEAQEFVDQHKIESDPVVGKVIFEEPEEKVAEWVRSSPSPRSSRTRREDSPTNMADGVSGEWLLRLQRRAKSVV
ncbi:hypothetical protein FALCPG4_003896 [Fusarium falciforme]